MTSPMMQPGGPGLSPGRAWCCPAASSHVPGGCVLAAAQTTPERLASQEQAQPCDSTRNHGMISGMTSGVVVRLRPSGCARRGPARRPVHRSSPAPITARAAPRASLTDRVDGDGQNTGRRSSLAIFMGALVSRAPEARADAADTLAEDEDSGGYGGYIRKAGKLGVILLLADVVTGLVLGKSAFDIATNKTEPGGWKEKLADQIMAKEPEVSFTLNKSQEQWKAELSPEEYRILRQKGTERPMTGEYNKFYPEEGHFKCAGCGNPLYSAQSKFDSGCGWPAFDKCYEGSVATVVDSSMGMRRVEILCQNCGGHLGHVFEGEQFTSTNERHCVNSVSIRYDAGKQEQSETSVTK